MKTNQNTTSKLKPPKSLPRKAGKLIITLPKLRLDQFEIASDPAQFKIVNCGRRYGKALALNTEVPTANGWKTMGTIEVGDTLYDEKGETCQVVFATEVQNNRECYQILFSNGAKIVADADHLWEIWDTRARLGIGKPSIKKTSEIAAHPNQYRLSVISCTPKIENGTRHIFLEEVKPVPSVPVRCIQVNSPSSLFLVTQSYIATHNTVLCFVVAFICAHKGGRVAWVTPTYANSEEFWITAEPILKQLTTQKLVSINKQEKMIRFLYSNGYIRCYSMDKDSSILGKGFNLMIIDEAARIPKLVWNRILKPCLADVGGDCIAISTPRGNNWFKEEFDRGQDEKNWAQIKSWRRPSWLNPMPAIQQFVSEQKLVMPEDDFRQEFAAEFIADGGEVFRNIRACATGEWHTEPDMMNPVAFGIDFARTRDSTVITGMRLRNKEQVFIEELKQSDYEFQKKIIMKLYRKWKPSVIVIESNKDQSIIDYFAKQGLPIQPFFTNNTTKHQIISELITSFVLKTISILPNEIQIKQLERYEKHTSSLGNIQYCAPKREHDDYVMALALCHHVCYEMEHSPLSSILFTERIIPAANPIYGYFSVGAADAAIVYASHNGLSIVIHNIEIVQLVPGLIVDKLIRNKIRYVGTSQALREFVQAAWRLKINDEVAKNPSFKSRLFYLDRPKDLQQRLAGLYAKINSSQLQFGRELKEDSIAWSYVTSEESHVADALAGVIDMIGRYQTHGDI